MSLVELVALGCIKVHPDGRIESLPYGLCRLCGEQITDSTVAVPDPSLHYVCWLQLFGGSGGVG